MSKGLEEIYDSARELVDHGYAHTDFTESAVLIMKLTTHIIKLERRVAELSADIDVLLGREM